MSLTRALYAERLKLKRTIALKMVLIAPLAVILLTLFITSQAPFSTLRSNSAMDEWKALTHINLQFWAILMLPLYLTLQTALIAGLDHDGNQWKALFARPVPRWTIYVSKLLIVLAMAVASAIVLVLGLIAEGAVLHYFDPELRFAPPAPVAAIAQQTAQMMALAFLSLTVSLWVSLRWRSFAVAIGFGSVAIVTGFAMLLAAGQYGTWPRYFPWSLPMLVIAKYPHDIGLAIAISGALGLVVAALGCRDFCRREIS